MFREIVGSYSSSYVSGCLLFTHKFHFVVWTHNTHWPKGSPKTTWLCIRRGEFGATQFVINFLSYFPSFILIEDWLLQFEDSHDAEDAIRGRDGYDFDGHRLRVGYN